jgi:hypothetical protein
MPAGKGARAVFGSIKPFGRLAQQRERLPYKHAWSVNNGRHPASFRGIAAGFEVLVRGLCRVLMATGLATPPTWSLAMPRMRAVGRVLGRLNPVR